MTTIATKQSYSLLLQGIEAGYAKDDIHFEYHPRWEEVESAVRWAAAAETNPCVSEWLRGFAEELKVMA